MSPVLYDMARVTKAPGVFMLFLGVSVLCSGFLFAEPEAVLNVGQEEAHARIFFRKKNYHAALRALKKATLTADGRWIKAESLFRLGDWALAKPHFLAIATGSDAIEKRKASIRLFDIAIKQGDLEESSARLVSFQQEFSAPLGRMRYALGKALYDAKDFDQAQKVLLGIKPGNEFYGRARYILATIGLDKKDAETAVKEFNEIEQQKPVSVEDYSIIQMAILAQARLWVDHGREDLAAKTYARIQSGPFKEVALSELLRAMLKRAHEAKNAQGRFKDTESSKRGLIARESLDSAAQALMSYRKTQRVSWENPELATLTASLMVETGRYDDARILLDGLMNHFRPLHASLTAEKTPELWPLFALNLEDNNVVRTRLLPGVPEDLQKGLTGIYEIVALRDRIEAGHQRLSLLLEKAQFLGEEQTKLLDKAKASQVALEQAYVVMAKKKQAKLAPKLAGIINQHLADAEFLRADLIVREMADVEQQMAAAQQFQNEKIELFETTLKEMDKGSAP